MNKKYIDFVPTKPGKKPAPKRVAPKKVMSKKTGGLEPEQGLKTTIYRKEVISGEKDNNVGKFSIKKEPNYGVIEDFRPKFVKTEVPKRPLSRSHFKEEKSELLAAKSKKIVAKKIESLVEKPVEKDKHDIKKEDKTKMKVPKSPFINQNKVAKRPLSKNVYERKVEPTKEASTGPVTIISKPESDAKISLVVTIILTIILGAAAGTIAFLLLPK